MTAVVLLILLVPAVPAVLWALYRAERSLDADARPQGRSSPEEQ